MNIVIFNDNILSGLANRITNGKKADFVFHHEEIHCKSSDHNNHVDCLVFSWP